MSGRLEGKVAVITGGASGIGRATAMRFLEEGARVVVGDVNESAGAATLQSAAKEGFGDRIHFTRTDVSIESDVVRMIDTAVIDFGRVDCVFNNAGIGGAFGSVMETEVEDWDFTFDVLTRGVFLGIKHGARAMVACGAHGSIINTASVAGFSGGDAPIAYSSAKAAVIHMTRAAAVELAQHRIRVNCICPGGIWTPLMQKALPADTESVLARLQPWPEAGRPEDIAGAALFLAGEDARFVTGISLVVDGGLSAAGHNIADRLREARSDGVTPGKSVGLDFGSTGTDTIVRRGGG
jgi:NAD(P)-dependent dehydrogenase (short-subunit alcohol dehydrogenase family)